MYCGQCGKRVLDTMLFCPFCGSPIVIPEQDEPEQPEPVQVAPEVEPIPGTESGAKPTEEVAPELAPAPEVQEPEAEAQVENEAPKPEEAEPVSLAETEPEHAPRFAESREAETVSFEETELEPEDKAEKFSPLTIEAPDSKRNSEGANGRIASLFDDLPEAEAKVAPEAPAEDLPEDSTEDFAETFAPLRLDDPDDIPADSDERPAPERASERVRSVAPERRGNPARPAQSSPRRRVPPPRGRRGAQTYIPVRDVNPNDMFMDSTHPAREEEFDPYDGDAERREPDFAFDEAEPEGFVQRHIRGVVGLILLAMLLVIFLIWAAMPRGQRVLAGANLAWNARVYDDLGREAYDDGQFRRAASYFERAFARDADNYDYAHSAMVAYYEAGDTESSLAMLKRCIDMQPDNPEPYAELMILYPDPQNRSWEVQQLLRQGYERTGEPALNDIGE